MASRFFPANKDKRLKQRHLARTRIFSSCGSVCEKKKRNINLPSPRTMRMFTIFSRIDNCKYYRTIGRIIRRLVVFRYQRTSVCVPWSVKELCRRTNYMRLMLYNSTGKKFTEPKNRALQKLRTKKKKSLLSWHYYDDIIEYYCVRSCGMFFLFNFVFCKTRANSIIWKHVFSPEMLESHTIRRGAVRSRPI